MSGSIASYAEICIILLDLVVGVVFDTFGRRIPMVVGFTTVGLCILLMPLFTDIYPSFLLLRIFCSIGLLPGINTPLLPDYIHANSLGLANAYVKLSSINDETFRQIL